MNSRYSEKSKFITFAGDFNAKIGHGTEGDPENIGNSDLGAKNSRRKMSQNLISEENSKSFYRKPKQKKVDIEK